MRNLLRKKQACIWLGLLLSIAPFVSNATEQDVTLYDPNPNHVWNRLHDALFIRTAPDGKRYGYSELDTLFWSDTKYLLKSPSHERALQMLDEFIRTHAERLIGDPMKRAMLQRDLWQLFDWTAAPNYAVDDPYTRAQIELQSRLVTVMKRVALSEQQIARLPDNLTMAKAGIEATGIASGLLTPDSDWVLVGTPQSFRATANAHVASFGGRSVFLVLVRVPEGREQARRYFQQLRDFSPALVYPEESSSGSASALHTNPATPQFPMNTQWAIARLLCLIDNQGRYRPTRLIESIQTRTYLSVGQDDVFDQETFRKVQRVAELQLDRQHAPALRAVAEGERDFQFVRLQSMGIDSFEHVSQADWIRNGDRIRSETLRTCFACHQGQGVLSVNTYAGFRRSANQLEVSTLESETLSVGQWKRGQFSWGLLQGLWRRIP